MIGNASVGLEDRNQGVLDVLGIQPQCRGRMRRSGVALASFIFPLFTDELAVAEV